MKIIKTLFIIMAFTVFFSSCKKDEEIDTEKPVIDLSIPGAFPLNCETLYFGEAFELKVLFSDNEELGSKSAFSIEIHNNFDHHSHSTEVTECDFDTVKEPVNPYLFIESFDIPPSLSEYETNLSLSIPSGDSNGDYDEGDYHFFLSLADKEGWSAQKGLSIKILHRE